MMDPNPGFWGAFSPWDVWFDDEAMAASTGIRGPWLWISGSDLLAPRCLSYTNMTVMILRMVLHVDIVFDIMLILRCPMSDTVFHTSRCSMRRCFIMLFHCALIPC